MFPSLRVRARDERGISLVELLVTIMIIGILAAIAIAILLNQRSKGSDVEAKEGATTAARAMEVCALDSDGIYNKAGSSCDKAMLTSIEPTLADLGSRLEEPVLDRTTYTVTVRSKREPSDVSFSVRKRADATFERLCAVGTQDNGGCPHPGGPGDGW